MGSGNPAPRRLHRIVTSVTVLKWQLAVSAALILWWILLIGGEAANIASEGFLIPLGTLLAPVAGILGIAAAVLAAQGRFTWAIVHGVVVTPVAVVAMLNMLLGWNALGADDDVVALGASIVLVVSAFAAVTRGPHIRPRGEDPVAALAESLRVTLLKHDSFRRGHRILDKLVRLLSGPLFYAFVAGAFFTVLTFIRPSTFVLGPLGATALLLAAWFGWIRLAERMAKPTIRTEPEDHAERSLIGRLDAGLPYGLYLRPFGSNQIREVLRDWNDVEFFAIDEMRRDSPVLDVPEIWIPTPRWRDLVFPLMTHASLCVVVLPPLAEMRAHRGLLAELEYAVRTGLQSRFLLIRLEPSPSAPAAPGIKAPARRLIELIEQFPNQTFTADPALRRRIRQLLSVAAPGQATRGTTPSGAAPPENAAVATDAAVPKPGAMT